MTAPKQQQIDRDNLADLIHEAVNAGGGDLTFDLAYSIAGSIVGSEWLKEHVAAARREAVIEELAGAADEWDGLERRGHDPLPCADIAGNLRARVGVLTEEAP